MAETGTRYTTGPWTQWKDHPAVFAGGVVENTPFSIKGGELVCECPEGETEADLTRACANARLVSAAPELLRVCEELASIATTDTDGNHVCWVGESTLVQARAAIAKATGAQP